jgi:hypothetical protein
MERNMIQHEITITKTGSVTLTFCGKGVWKNATYCSTLDRDLELHREGDLPAYRGWENEETLLKEGYYRNGKWHREGDLPAYREWHPNGNLSCEIYFLNGEEHREGGQPAYREWCWNGKLGGELYYLEGYLYDPT